MRSTKTKVAMTAVVVMAAHGMQAHSQAHSVLYLTLDDLALPASATAGGTRAQAPVSPSSLVVSLDDALHSTPPGAPRAPAMRLSLDDTAPLQAAPPPKRGPQRHAGPAPAMRLSLDDAVLLALKGNRDLTNARLARVVQRHALRAAEDEFRPRFTLGSGATRTGSEGGGSDTSSELSSRASLKVRSGGEFAVTWRGARSGGAGSAPYSGAVGLTFTQPLLRGGGVEVATAGLASARRSEERNVMAFRDTLAGLVVTVARLYRAHGQARRAVEIAERGRARAGERYEANRLFVQTGRMSRKDLVQNEAEITQREIGLAAAHNGLDSARLNLVGVLDVDSTTQFVLTDALEAGDLPVPIDANDSLARALAHRTDHRAALLGLKEARQHAALARNGRLWDLSLSLSLNLAGDGANDVLGTVRGLDPGNYSAGLALSVPFGRAAGDPARVAHLNAVIAREQAQNEYQELRHAIEVEVLNAVRAVHAAHTQVTLARDARRLTEETVEIERGKLASGLSTNFQVVALEDDLLAVQSQELDSVVAYLNTVIALDQTLGTTLETWGIDVEAVEGVGDAFDVVRGWTPELPRLF